MDRLKEIVGRLDTFQRDRSWLGFPVGVWKKFGDDQAGNLAALIAYYAFVSIFPLLLVLATLLQIVLHSNPGLRERLVKSALHAYPVIGPEIGRSVHALTSTGIALVIGLVGAVLGARGVAIAMQNALSSVWAIPRQQRPGFPMSTVLAIELIVVVGVGQIAAAALSGLAGGLGHVISGAGAEVATIALSFVANVGVFWLAFRIATARKVSWRDLRLAAVLSAASWQLLLLLGGYFISHLLHRSSALYGVFGVVLGMLAWLYLQAQITLYAVEAAAVRAWRLWPRGLAAPPTEQDLSAYEYYARADRHPPPASD
jgi:membrane protein